MTKVVSVAPSSLACPTVHTSSSAWSAYCKGIFKKYSGVACPPKMLRASFVTWIRNSEASPEVLQQAARDTEQLVGEARRQGEASLGEAERRAARDRGEWELVVEKARREVEGARTRVAELEGSSESAARESEGRQRKAEVEAEARVAASTSAFL